MGPDGSTIRNGHVLDYTVMGERERRSGGREGRNPLRTVQPIPYLPIPHKTLVAFWVTVPPVVSRIVNLL